MGIFDFIGNLKAKAEPEATRPNGFGVDVVDTESKGYRDGIFKAYIPKFLYKPPFGYPRPENIPLLKQFGEYPYLFSVISMLQEEAACSSFKIVAKSDDVKIEDNPDLQLKRQEILDFFDRPNENKESFADLIKACVRDICEVDAGVWVKVFNRQGKMVQLFARDGGAFLKNPDIYGYMGDRVEIIFPDSTFDVSSLTETEAINHYELKYKHQAAYFQYGWTTAAMPIPFGKREIIYFSKNPRSDHMYGISPIKVLGDIVLTLVYGSQYNLDFYMNSNIPEGILSVLGASADQIRATKERMSDTHRVKDTVTGFWRRIGFRMPVVNVPVDFKPFMLPSREMQIIEQQQWFTKVVWMCFGVTADDMGFTENSNKAVSQSMERRYAKKAVRPILKLIEERINHELICEFGTNELLFKFEDYDLDDDIKRHQLYESQIRMGIKTPEMVAEEEKIDIIKLKKQKDENAKKEMEQNEQNNKQQNSENDYNKADIKATEKDIFEDTILEKELVAQINDKAKQLKEALKTYSKGALNDVR